MEKGQKAYELLKSEILSYDKTRNKRSPTKQFFNS